MKNKENNHSIVFENVAARYGRGPEILKGISFDFEPGSFHFLTGQSGAGKTTLLKLIYLSLKPTRGRVKVFGVDTTQTDRKDLPLLRRKIGVIFQDFNLLNHLTSYENVAMPLRIAGFKETEIKKRVEQMLSWVGLEDKINSTPPTLSGGQQQRVALARAVINRPKIIFADEPTGSVDKKIAEKIINLFVELNKLGTTVVIATHSEALIREYPYPRIHLNEGKAKILPAFINAKNYDDSFYSISQAIDKLKEERKYNAS